MAYSSITKPKDYFETTLITGNGSTQNITGLNFQPDWIWYKRRNATGHNRLIDSVRGSDKLVQTDLTNAEGTDATYVTSFNSDGWSIGSNTDVNASSGTTVAWSWKAGGTAPAITYVVKVVSDSGNKYRFDDFGTSAVTLDLQEGGTYTFDQSDSSNSGHPLRFYTASDKTGGEYTTGVTTTGTPGSSGAQTVITVAASAPTLYYQCSNHAGMGGQANTNSLFGSSNFSGSIQSTVSAGTTQGFSIVKVAKSNTNVATIGHGLGVIPKFIIGKDLDGADNWTCYSEFIGNAKGIYLNATNAEISASTFWNSTSPTSSVFTIGSDNTWNSPSILFYCFADVKGYSKFGTYTGNGSTAGPFIYTGFKPAWIMSKSYSNTESWIIKDATRDPVNPADTNLAANSANSESTWGTEYDIDILSNGFKMRDTAGQTNGNGYDFIYLAFAENPFVGNDSGTAVPATAR